jgi:hypothetical protein
MGKSQGCRGLPPQYAPILLPLEEGGRNKLLSTNYSDTSAKVQDLSPDLDDKTLLADLDNFTTTTDWNVSLVKSEMRDKAGVDAAILAKNWGIGIEVSKRTRLVTTQRGVRRMIHPSLIKQ